MRGRHWLGLLFALLCFFAASPALAEGVSRALLVGCDRFVTQEDTFPSSENNVAQMADALSGGAMNLETLVTRKSDVTSPEELEELIQAAFSEAEAGDVSYFYISTHGVWEQGQPNGSMQLLLSDGRRENGVTANQLRTMFDKIRGTKVLILDACHSGAVIGKGVHAPFTNVFAGSEYKVICSSGGAEESWFWSGTDAGEAVVGAGYFSGALVNGLSSKGGYSADANRDGVITLTELKRYLLANHGASTVQTYPEEDEFPVLRYDADSFTGRRRDSQIESVFFSDDVLSADTPDVDFSFTVLKPVQMAYQLVYQRRGRWDFDHAEVLYDESERIGAAGYLSPGMKERTVTLNMAGDGSFGYALVQLITQQDGVPTLISSRALCVPPPSGSPEVSISADSSFCPDLYEELGFVVLHAFPCELTVTIEDVNGRTVRRLASHQPTRPQQLLPRGSSFTWNGLTADGEPAGEGVYRIRVKAHVGDEVYEAVSAPIALLAGQG